MILQLFSNSFLEPFVGKVRRYKKRSIRQRGDSGVYFIRQNDIIVYVGMSQSCVVEALYRHFYHYNDTHRKPRTYYDVADGNHYTVYILYCTKEDTPKLERGLILGINPRDNRDKFQHYLDDLSAKNIKVQQTDSLQETKEDLPF